jgi:hypothetical protein
MGDSEPPPIERQLRRGEPRSQGWRNRPADYDFRDLLLRCNTFTNSLKKVLDDYQIKCDMIQSSTTEAKEQTKCE